MNICLLFSHDNKKTYVFPTWELLVEKLANFHQNVVKKHNKTRFELLSLKYCLHKLIGELSRNKKYFKDSNSFFNNMDIWKGSPFLQLSLGCNKLDGPSVHICHTGPSLLWQFYEHQQALHRTFCKHNIYLYLPSETQTHLQMTKHQRQ